MIVISQHGVVSPRKINNGTEKKKKLIKYLLFREILMSFTSLGL